MDLPEVGSVRNATTGKSEAHEARHHCGETTMKQIRNPLKHCLRLTELIRLNAQAIKHHRPRKDIQREMQMIRTALMAYENRRAA